MVVSQYAYTAGSLALSLGWSGVLDSSPNQGSAEAKERDVDITKQ